MSTASGQAAEEAAATFLRAKGHTVLVQNWRTRWCEIDIVTRYGDIVHFVEVKYRANVAWGSGFDYITERKRQQMQFAAEFWCAQQDWLGDYMLSAAELSGNPPLVTQWLAEL